MLRTLGSHVRHNVIGYIALFFALSGGVAWATHPGGANTISSGDIINDQVYSADVRNDTLSGGGLAAADLRPASVGTSEVAANSLNGGDINESSLGIVPNADQLDGIDSSGFLGASAKAADADLLDGKNSTEFLSHDLVLSTADVTVSPGFGTSSTVNCPGGRVALGGGVGFIGPSGEPSFHAGSPVVLSRPKPDLDGWIAGMTNNLISPMTMRIYVICAA